METQCGFFETEIPFLNKTGIDFELQIFLYGTYHDC